MNRTAIALAAAALILAGCKTSEENYRRSYEAAVGKRDAAEATADSLETAIHNKVIAANEPRQIEVGGRSVGYLEGNAWQPQEVETANTMRRYSVVAGAMRQLFNAKALNTRLAANGCPSYVIVDAQKNYYVIAAGFDTLEAAADYAASLPSSLPIKIPVAPFVYRTTRL